MDQDQTQRSNRFIFSNDFYDQLGSEPEEKKVSFDVPSTKPIETKIEETTNSTPSFFNNKIESNETNTSTMQKEDEKVEIPTFNFINPKPTDINVNNDNLVSSENSNIGDTINNNVTPLNNLSSFNIDSKSNDDNVANINSETVNNNTSTDINSEMMPLNTFNSIGSTNEQNNLDIDSGIDTALEQEIMRTKVENQVKAPIVENNSFFKEPEEKQVYRARRNAPTAMPIWIQEEEKKEQAQIVKPEINLSLNNRIVTPPIINIDEEILKDSSNMEEDKEEFNYEDNDNTSPVVKSTLLDELRLKEQQTGKISILAHYGDDFCSRDYITNPAIGRKEEIKQLILILLTPEKSGILVGKPGIGKTSIVEGLAYQLQRNNVPDALKGYRIVSVKTTSLLGTLPSGETRLQTLIDELKELDKIILFIDEIHMLMGATSESSLDFANMFKESLGRGSIKMIGATTNDEYERYVLRDKAFVRRFQRVDVEEPTREQTIKILMGTLPKIEKNTGAKLKYSSYIQSEIMAFIVDITTEYKRVYGIGSRYPDICLTLLSQAFSQAVFDNRGEVNIFDIRNAIENSKNIYPDVIRKELVNFDTKFKQIIDEEKGK
ncbi:MAG: AAA family ATPase [Tenericutes bacterium]|nr:AAA family ATPase [Mycoplasmatota bacterium]